MKVPADQEKEKKDRYVKCCHELNKDFTPMVYSVNGMARREAKMAEKYLASYLAEKWHHPYSQMVPSVRLRIWLSIARTNILLIHGSCYYDAAHPFIQSGSRLHPLWVTHLGGVVGALSPTAGTLPPGDETLLPSHTYGIPPATAADILF